MITVIAGIAYFILAVLGLIFWWIPVVFNTVKGLFEGSDLGTLAGLIAAYVTVGGYVFVASLIGVALVTGINVFIQGPLDERKRRQRRRR